MIIDSIVTDKAAEIAAGKAMIQSIIAVATSNTQRVDRVFISKDENKAMKAYEKTLDYQHRRINSRFGFAHFTSDLAHGVHEGVTYDTSEYIKVEGSYISLWVTPL